MDNTSLDLDVLQLEGLLVSPEASAPAFVVLLLLYAFIVVSNGGLVVLIALEPTLHQPMYLLFCNMSVNDVFGASAVLPRLLGDVLAPRPLRLISYRDCVLQAFCAHFYAGTCHTVITAMAFDRYVAVCHPLRYGAVMSGRTVASLSLSAWAVSFALIAVLIGLSVRLSRCRRLIDNPFCDNASLFKLSCDDVLVNHVYGLGSAMSTMGCSLAAVALTYLRIAAVCLRSRSRTLNTRALQTCATHLAVYAVLLLSGNVIIILHRFPELSGHRKLASILFHVIPPSMNAVIYGLQIRSVREKIAVRLSRKRRL